MKLLIWDFDGTLAYRPGLWSAALADVARAHIPGCAVPVEAFAPHLKAGFYWHHPERPHLDIHSADAWWHGLSPVLVGALTKATGATRAQAQALMPAVRACFVDPARWKLFDDVLPCLDALSGDGWRHVILSNHVPELPQLVTALGLDGHVSHVFNSATLGYEKPHPEAFAAVRRAFGGASTVRMIGDNYSADVAGAEATGVRAMLVRKPHPKASEFHASLSSIPSALAMA
jgi:putative hydrolase of the HAD superfamily